MLKAVTFVVATLLFAACAADDGFVVDGQVDNVGNEKTVVLYEGARKLDSVFLDEHGKFKLRRVASYPRLFSLKVGERAYQLILQNGDRVTFRADLTQPADTYQIKGSALSDTIKAFAGAIAEKEQTESALEAQFAQETAGLDDRAVASLRQEFLIKYRSAMQGYTKKAVQFAREHDDLAGFYAMSTLDIELAEQELVAYADRITGKWDGNVQVRQFLDELAKVKLLAIGQPAPEFESRTPNNQRVKLSDVKGKYTLVDFWASWCGPCREENPNIVKQYHAYKDKGFTVLGVSLDGNPGAWMRAIEEDGLTWTQVSDLQEWGSEVVGLYRIKAIPTSYLVDPNGIIIAKNLRQKALGDFLKKTLD